MTQDPIRIHRRIIIPLCCGILFSVLMSNRSHAASQSHIVYGENPATTLAYRLRNGSSWSSESSSPSIAAAPTWIVAKNCPTRSNEMIVVALDNTEDLNAMFYDGTSWSGLIELTSNTVTSAERPFYVAYEQNSGDALVAYRTASDGTIRYRSWNGSAWSSEGSIATASAGNVKQVKLVSRPGSDEIMLIAVDSKNDITASVWTGITFSNTIALDTDAYSSGTECLDAAYESVSGRCMVVWSHDSENSPRYRIWSGSAWLTQGSVPDIGGIAKWVRLASSPTSDKIIMSTIDNAEDCNVNVWSGSNWGVNLEVQTDVSATDRRAMDVAFEWEGTRALIVYGRSGSNYVLYRLYQGSSWSVETTGPDIGNRPSVVQLQPSFSGQEIMLGIVLKNTGALYSLRWDGASLVELQQLETDVAGAAANECFMIAPIKAKKRIVKWYEIVNKP